MNIQLFLLLVLTAFIPIPGYATNSISDVKIVKITPTPDSVVLSFDKKPDFCIGYSRDYHGVIKRTNSSFEENVSAAYASKILNQPVEIMYLSQGDCTSEDSALDIITVGGELKALLDTAQKNGLVNNTSNTTNNKTTATPQVSSKLSTNLEQEFDDFLNGLENFQQDIDDFVDREGSLLGAQVDQLLADANISLVEGNLLWQGDFDSRIETGHSCLVTGSFLNTFANARIFGDGTGLEINIDRDLSKPIYLSVDLHGDIEADGRIKLRYGARIFGSCVNYASDSFGFDLSTGLIANLTLQLNLNPSLLEDEQTIRLSPEIFLTGDLMLEDFLLNVNVNEIDTIRFISDVVSFVSGSELIGEAVFYLLNDFIENEIDAAPETIVGAFYDIIDDLENDLQADINNAIVGAGGVLFTGRKGNQGLVPDSIVDADAPAVTLSRLDIAIPAISTDHVNQMAAIINRPGFGRFPVSVEYVNENRGAIAYSLLTGDDRFLIEEVFTALACEGAEGLITPLQVDQGGAPFSLFNRSFSTFCNEYINTEKLGNSRDLYKAPAQERNGWSTSHASQFNVGVEDIEGNALPYMRRLEYKYVRESGLNLPYVGRRFEEQFGFEYDYYGIPFDTNDIIGYEGTRYQLTRHVGRFTTYRVNDKSITFERDGSLSGEGYDELLKLRDELKAVVDEKCNVFSGEDVKKCRQDEPRSFFNSGYVYPNLRECSLEMRVYSKTPGLSNQKPLIALHGGSWKFRGLGYFGIESQISHYTDQGFVVFAPFYRLIGDSDGPSGCQNAEWTDLVADVEDALDWVQANGDDFGANVTPGVPIPVVGQSAGAHLAAWLATERPEEISRALLFYPPVDFSNAIDLAISGEYNNPTGIASFEDFIGLDEDQAFEDIDKNSTVIQRNSMPEIVLEGGADNFPQFFMLHGDSDELVPSSQSVRLCNSLAGSLTSGPANTRGTSTREIFECSFGSELHLFEEANHILDFCIPSVSCPAGSDSSQYFIANSMAQTRDWLSEPSYQVIATEDYLDPDLFCGWSFYSDYGGIYTEDLYCRMGADKVASRHTYDQNGNIGGVRFQCNISYVHSDYALTKLNRDDCTYEIVRKGEPRTNKHLAPEPTPSPTPVATPPPPVATTFAANAPVHSSLPSSSSRTLASGCSWQQNYDNYGSVSYDLICYGTKYANLLRYYSSNIVNSPYACEVEVFVSGVSGSGNYGQAGNVCNFTIRGHR